jgi:SAM-dependent methyltransferase
MSMAPSDGGAGKPPQAVVMQLAMGAWAAQAVAAVTRLGVPDLLHQHGPLDARALCERHGVDAQPAVLERALRACASLAIFTEDVGGRFGPTALSEVLTLEAPGSVKRFVEQIGGRWWTLFGGLPEALRTGRHQTRTLLGREPWEPLGPRETEEFAEAMRSRRDSTRAFAERCDLSAARILVDVGGGLGHVAMAALARHPALQAVVLDRPEVISIARRHAAAESADIRARLRFEAGDMFDEVPTGDTFLLRSIIHDWDDERAERVLRNCRARLLPGGRILCVDNVLPPLGDTGASGTKLLDLLMLVSLPGRERTEPEWRALFAAAGLGLESLIRLNPLSVECLIVGAPASDHSPPPP